VCGSGTRALLKRLGLWIKESPFIFRVDGMLGRRLLVVVRICDTILAFNVL
jgi:hypothetical protein